MNRHKPIHRHFGNRHPEWEWLLAGPWWGLPLIAYDKRDTRGEAPSASSFGAFSVTEAGISYLQSSTGQYLQYPEPKAVSTQITDRMTMWCAVRPTTAFTPGGEPARVLDYSDGTGNGNNPACMLGYRTDIDEWQIRTETSGGRVIVETSGATVTPGLVTVAVGRMDGTNAAVWSLTNGVSKTNSAAQSGAIANKGAVTIGNLNYSLWNRTFPGHVLACGIIPWAIPDSQVFQLLNDPFGPFRAWRRPIGRAVAPAPAGAVISPYYSAYYRRMVAA